MMNYYYILSFLFLISYTDISGQTSTDINFPEDYFGIYKGTLEVISSRGPSSYPMEFHLQPTDSVGRYEYKLVYGAGDQRQERPYFLVEQDKSKGTYIVDEDNGILLDDKVVDNRMYALFEVGGSLLTTFITFESDHLIFEIVATKKEDRRVTYAENEERTEVISYPITTVQRAVLQKQ